MSEATAYNELMRLLSDEERNLWRTLDGFMHYVDAVTALLSEYPSFIQREHASGQSPEEAHVLHNSAHTILSELFPLRHFADYYRTIDPHCHIRHLGNSHQPDGEIHFSDESVKDLEVTIATDSAEPPDDTAAHDTLITRCAAMIFEAIERKMHNNHRCWLIISYNDSALHPSHALYTQLRHTLNHHLDKPEWLEHFSRIFVIGAIDGQTLEVE